MRKLLRRVWYSSLIAGGKPSSTKKWRFIAR